MKKGIVVSVSNEEQIENETYVLRSNDFLSNGTRKTTMFLVDENGNYREKVCYFANPSEPIEFLKVGDIVAIENGQLFRNFDVYKHFPSWLNQLCDEYVLRKIQAIKTLPIEERLIEKDQLEQFRDAIQMGRYLDRVNRR